MTPRRKAPSVRSGRDAVRVTIPNAAGGTSRLSPDVKSVLGDNVGAHVLDLYDDWTRDAPYLHGLRDAVADIPNGEQVVVRVYGKYVRDGGAFSRRFRQERVVRWNRADDSMLNAIYHTAKAVLDYQADAAGSSAVVTSVTVTRHGVPTSKNVKPAADIPLATKSKKGKTKRAKMLAKHDAPTTAKGKSARRNRPVRDAMAPPKVKPAATPAPRLRDARGRFVAAPKRGKRGKR